VPSSINATFVYDGDGKRVAQTLNGVTTYFIGNYYEVTGSAVTKYYFAGAQRIAMRTNGALYYLLSDHLGSTSLTTDASGNVLSEMRYSAWGGVRYNSGITPTDYTYTGQYSDSYINLLWYGSRHYDPELGRFIQPDTIVPDPNNPQAWDRYSYTFNNPVRYTDPSGHDPAGNCYDKGYCKVDPDADIIRQDILFSEIFKGSGSNDTWTNSDWNYYHKYRDDLWAHPNKWINPDTEKGWDLFALHASRLASHYSADQKADFVKDFALVFGGVPYSNGVISGTVASRHGPAVYHGTFNSFLNEGNAGLDQQYLDIHPDSNQSHHYAGIFFTAYFYGIGSAQLGNLARDPANPGDIDLGNGAADDALTFSNATDLSIIGKLILFYENP